MAWNSIGLCYETGKGVDKDLTKCYEWYKRSAEAGYAGGNCLGKKIMCQVAYYNIGLCYHFERGVVKDMNVAYEWYMKAASHGYSGIKCVGLCVIK